MDLRRLRAGEWIIALSGVALLVSLFLPWYGDDLTAWEALAVNDVILAAIGLAAIAALIATAGQRVPAVPIALEAVVTVLGFVALVLVAVRAIWIPDGADGREWGLWLALAGAAGIAVSGWIAAADDTMAGTPPQPDPEPLPAPRP
jgi:hypothetical protein